MQAISVSQLDHPTTCQTYTLPPAPTGVCCDNCTPKDMLSKSKPTLPFNNSIIQTTIKIEITETNLDTCRAGEHLQHVRQALF